MFHVFNCVPDFKFSCCRLKPLDIEFMKQLHNKVNVVPVIAKADVLTKKEMQRLKKKVLDEIAENGIRIYSLPECDSDEDEEYKEQVRMCFLVLFSAVFWSF